MPPPPVHHHYPPPVHHHYPPPFSSQTPTSSDHHVLLVPPSQPHTTDLGLLLDPLAEFESPAEPCRHESSVDSESCRSFRRGVCDENRFVDLDLSVGDHTSDSDSPLSLSRCSSSGSIVTQAASESFGRRSVDAPARDTESSESHWTDDKHRSYLTLMEENFVKDLYDREYCALDVCGQAPRCSHSDATSAQSQLDACEFKSWRNGDWQWRRAIPWKRLRSPYILSHSDAGHGLFQNPWINRFRRPVDDVAAAATNNSTLPVENPNVMMMDSSNSWAPSDRSARSRAATSTDKSIANNHSMRAGNGEIQQLQDMGWNPKAENATSLSSSVSPVNSRKRGCMDYSDHAELHISTRQRFSDGKS